MTTITWEIKSDKLHIYTNDARMKKLLYKLEDIDHELTMYSCWAEDKDVDLEDSKSPTCIIIPKEKIGLIIKAITGINVSFDIAL